jgi:sialidase-1
MIVAAILALQASDLFVAGQDGYHTFRIPSLIVTTKGTLLAFAEGRKKGRGDAGDIDVVLRRSTDGGASWGPLQGVWDEADNTCGNPCPVVDAKTGTVWLPLTHNLGKDVESKIIAGTSAGTRTAWICRSDDDGATWTKPVEITKSVKRPDWTWFATGPGVGLQMKSGRLVVPCDAVDLGGKRSYSLAIFSDDGGATWAAGDVVGDAWNECQVAELSDGALMLNMRNHLSMNRTRGVALSRDGGKTWGPATPDAALVEPACQASLVRASWEPNRLLFSNPAGAKRERMTVKLSLDDGRSWPRSLTLHEGPAAYSCLAVLPGGRAACLFEAGDKQPYEKIVFAPFAIDALK